MKSSHAAIAAVVLLSSVGPADAAGTTFQRDIFLGVGVPATAGQVKILKTMKFTAGATGTALFHARGHCDLALDASKANFIDIEIRKFSDPPFANAALADWGLIGVPATTTTGTIRAAWSAETTAAVTSGKSYTFVVAARHETTTAGATACRGSMTMEIH